MARNGSGTYTIPNNFTANTTAESSKVNQNFTDLGSEITNSLPRDGQVGMTGQFKAATGSATAPSITFASDTNSGFYRAAGDEIGIAVGGTYAGSIVVDGITDPDGDFYTNFKPGTRMLFQQTTAPVGWTKDALLNNRALRIVSGVVGSGGTKGFTTAFAERTILRSMLPNVTLNVSGSTDNRGSHLHSVPNGGNTVSVDSGGVTLVVGVDSQDTGVSGQHEHDLVGAVTASINGGVTQTTFDFDVLYTDVIVAQKDATA